MRRSEIDMTGVSVRRFVEGTGGALFGYRSIPKEVWPIAKLLRIVQREQCIGCGCCMMACSRTWRNTIGFEKAALKVRAYHGVEGAFSIRACYGCIDPDCARACPTGALTPRKGGGVQLDESLCIHCGLCIEACAPSALQWDFSTRIPLPCRHCGVCVSFCPNHVLEMMEVDQR